MISPGEHIVIFGLTGCGKSTLTRRVTSIFKRKIIFDRLGEWQGQTVWDYEAFRRFYQYAHAWEEFTILVRPRPGLSPDALTELSDSILALVYQVEGYNRPGLAVVFEEVWLYAPLHNTPRWFLETLLTGRHQRISIIGNSQRPANVSKTLVSQARHVFIGQFFEASDKRYYRETLGGRIDLERPPEKFHFYWVRPNEPIQTVRS